MENIVLLFLFVLIELFYFKIADRFNIIDKPNNRSSHTRITLRGGGIIFPIALIIAFFLGYVSPWVTIAVVVVAIVSFIDDVYPLPTLPRFLSHCIACSLLCFELHLFSQPLWLLPILFVLLIGWINAFNFMDGINGITVLYALVSIATFAYVHQGDEYFQVLVLLGLACVVFGFFNVRKRAKTFAGDVGSISMAVFLAYFMLQLIFENGQIGYLLFFSVYGIDAIVTILYRIKSKENIFQAHRSHLYQYLANELGWSQITVSVLYALFQLVINSIVLALVAAGELSVFVFLLICLALAGLYMGIRIRVQQLIKLK
jgi:UDP-N-acetylmuramyl pentapeptide phosphotransferase/UDP-N-acetylglucosamine-1-phosphate transferase